ncbi:hypothetical protein M2119_000026 [Aurantimicrobium minutum]|uniref:hypothetical protein n=1 Tax=Aurantimicrobium minutum TaxID=708131 RepID=UPI002473987D|nr:hypothetical protein [Aurantimicrobium minutum]MDH6531789.1 hypothetical protein [Aurantimicrobium minutum]
MSGEAISPSPKPGVGPELEVIWELFPGLQAKLEYFAKEKNCEGLKLLSSEYSKKNDALDSYLNQELDYAGCK